MCVYMVCVEVREQVKEENSPSIMWVSENKLRLSVVSCQGYKQVPLLAYNLAEVIRLFAYMDWGNLLFTK